MKIEKDPRYSLSEVFTGKTSVFSVAPCRGLEPRTQRCKNYCLLSTLCPMCPCTLQNWVVFVHPVQYVKYFQSNCTKHRKPTQFRNLFALVGGLKMNMLRWNNTTSQPIKGLPQATMTDQQDFVLYPQEYATVLDVYNLVPNQSVHYQLMPPTWQIAR